MVQYYTLEEAARKLQTTADKLKEMARKGELRAFQDRGNLRFRAQEVDELARARGLGSDPELQPADVIPLAPDPAASPAASGGPRSPSPEDSEAILDFGVADSGRASGSGAGKSDAPGSGAKRKTGPRPSSLKAPPPVSSDSDVRLVADGSDLDFQVEDVPAARSPAPARSPAAPKSPTPSKGSKSKLGGPTRDQPDSGVRILPVEPPDSDVKLVGDDRPSDSKPSGGSGKKKPSDSDIRMDERDLPAASKSGRHPGDLITEEIDLDAEERKLEESTRPKPPPPPTTRPKAGKPTMMPALPTESPFELSESDLRLQDPDRPSTRDDSGSDEITLLPPDDSSAEQSPLESSPLEAGSEEVPLLRGDEEVSLGELTGAGGGSGINLQDPADSGISLEQGGSDEIEFELSLEPGATPKPIAGKPKGESETEESSSEFELSVKESEGEEEGSSSEFELTLDGEGSSEVGLQAEGQADSDSEFELTLDESGGLASAEEAAAEEGGEDKDIFETDFEVPALDEESGSEAVALDSDTDVETADFDLGSGTGSQVVELEEGEEAEAGAATIKRPSRKRPDVLTEDETELEEEEEARTVYREAPPAEWGVAAPLGALACSLVLFVVTMMSFELVQGMWGYHKQAKVSSLFVDPIARLFDDQLPKQD